MRVLWEEIWVVFHQPPRPGADRKGFWSGFGGVLWTCCIVIPLLAGILFLAGYRLPSPAGPAPGQQPGLPPGAVGDSPLPGAPDTPVTPPRVDVASPPLPPAATPRTERER
jgi:hypothetical protein